MKKITTLIVALAHCFLLLGCDYENSRNGGDVTYPNEKSLLSREKLISAIQAENVDLVVRLLNEVKASRDSESYYSMLSNLWNLDVSLYPGVSRQFLLNKAVRIEIADVLLQGIANHKYEADSRQFLDYSRNVSKEDGCGVYSNAVLIIGRSNVPQDLDLIEKTVLMENECFYRAAVLGLVQRCDMDFDRVSRLGGMIKNREIEIFLMETWRKFEDFRAVVCRRK